ncbi:expressed unknown protein [Seminavis robusta]|uniref:Uncharacterized protein n=1 Tax=Seminavis robusta TaxID=568900 RepID=A0A9N8ENZ2_9STRA|nr:expressed unknown protein [Seminavis robusta]|eukprot:Sro1660_g289320.1 n/a (411) ;mRNA; r:14947-16298
MLCCTSLWQDPASAYNAQTNDAGVSPFPGQRRPLVQSAGNGNLVMPPSPLMVNVVIPPGMQAGQTLQVAAPDGSRTVSATIPQGMEAGQSFFVTFPNAVAGSTADNQSNGSGSNGSGNVNNATSAAPAAAPMAAAPVLPPVASPLNTKPDQSGTPFSQALDRPTAVNAPRPIQQQQPMAPPHQHLNSNSTANQQHLLLVNVPPGAQAGSTLYVQVPGENRTLAAKVPPGVAQFHVAYQPRASAPPAPTIHPNSNNRIGNSTANPIPTNNNGQKLILVRVPPGTAPGTTLHVEVPDEPGRILAAQVPRGVSEFQVAYMPRNGNVTQQGYDIPQRPGNMQSQGNMQGPGNMMLPYVGAAALAGAAGVAMYDHYHNAAAYQDYGADGYDTGAYDAGAYDYGAGADYGGDYGDF